jgi:putative hydrolase of the HAD superfamily
MRFKVLMVDVDGVLIVHPDPDGWSANLARDLGLDRETLQAGFFEPHWRDIVLGRASLHDRLRMALADIAPAISPAALIQYWFENDSHLDHSLLAQLGSIRSLGVQLHLATVQEHERAKYIWNELGMKNHFDDMHYAADLGCTKPDERFYESIEARSGFSSREIFFIDDKQANIDAALARGWSGHVWDGTGRLDDLLTDGCR